MKNNRILLIPLVGLLMIILSTDNLESAGPQFFAPNGDNLQRVDQNHVGMTRMSITTSRNNPVFLTSSKGAGYQAMIPANSTQTTRLAIDSSALIACQYPLGMTVKCIDSCTKGSTYSSYNTKCSSANLTIDLPTIAPKDTPYPDLLNEFGTQNTAYVFLDTIINNSDYNFEVWTTEAPLHRTIEGGGYDPLTIAGVLTSSSNQLDQLYDTLYDTKKIKIGNKSYDLVQMSPAEDFKIKAGTTRRHMANPNWALSPLTSSGTQTIILFPEDYPNNPQPVIFIGRDQNNVMYVLSFIKQTACKENDGSMCKADGELKRARVNVPVKQTQVVPKEQPGRLKVVIDQLGISMPNVYGEAVNLGAATSVNILPGLWWPGQPDFQ